MVRSAAPGDGGAQYRPHSRAGRFGEYESAGQNELPESAVHVETEADAGIETSELRRRFEQLRRLQAEAVEPDGLKRVLRCMARNIDGYAMVLDDADRPLEAYPERRDDLLPVLAEGLARVRADRMGSVAIDNDAEVLFVLPVSRADSAPILVAAGRKPLPAHARPLVTDAVRPLALAWRMGLARGSEKRVYRADTRIRESVLHLLMVGDSNAAERVAATLRPSLPNPVQVLILEVPGRSRDELAAQCIEVSAGRAFVVPCPVYVGHVIVLGPGASPGSDPESTDRPGSAAGPLEDRFRGIARDRSDVCIGASALVSLRESPAGYEQAFHALACARESAERYGRFRPGDDLGMLLASAGESWQLRILSPLLDFVPERTQDPGPEDLKITLVSWLTFAQRAARQLKIHRNTLTARLKQIERVLGHDLREIRTQAMLHLALRLLDRPRARTNPRHEQSTEELFGASAVRSWAQHQLSSLLQGTKPTLLNTLRVWLENNAQMDATAATLGLSEPGARKRLLRIEGLLGRSLLHGPSARYELWFALRALDGKPLPASLGMAIEQQ